MPLTTFTFDTALFAQVSLQKFNVPQLSFNSLKNEGNSAICDNMEDLEDIMLSENKPDTESTV